MSDEPERPAGGPGEGEAPRGVESRFLLHSTLRRVLGREPEPVRVGRYRVVRPLGHGGMGVVYAAWDEQLGREVAIKVLRRAMAEGAASDHVWVEARALARLSHPNVVHVYEVGEDDGRLYLVMERVEGQSLRAWQRGGHGWREVVGMYLGAARGLCAAHAAGIVHRDFKADNVIVGADGRPRVVDFGLAQLPEQDDARPEDRAGTPAYMAPEQARGAEVDGRADQYALAAALHEALTGRLPGRADEAGGHDVPAEVLRVLSRGASPERQDRFPDMDAFIEALVAAAFPPPPRRRLWPWIAAGVFGVLAPLALWWGAARSKREAEPVAAPSAPAWSVMAPPVQPEPAAHDPFRVTVHRLDNGLTVYVAPRHDTRRVETRVVIRAGYDEQGDALGLAHVVMAGLDQGTTHMGVLDPAAEAPYLERRLPLFAAYTRAADEQARARAFSELRAAMAPVEPLWLPEEVPNVLPALGARTYGALQDDITRMVANVPRNRLSAWATFEAELMAHATFRNFPRAALQAANEARAVARGAPLAELVIDRELRPHTGYAFDPAREVAWLQELRLADALAFYGTWYAPNNAAVVLVGDVEPEDALPVIERAFGAWTPRPLPEHAPVYRPLPARREVEVTSPRPRLDVAYPLPIPTAQGVRGFDLLARVLAHGQGPLAGRWEVQHTTRSLILTRPGPAAPEDARAVEGALRELAGAVDPAAGRLRGLLRRLRLRELEASDHPEAVADLLARTFAAGAAWEEHVRLVYAPGLGSEAAVDLDRELLAEAARTLLDAAPLVVVTREGSRPELALPPALPLEPASPREGRSVFVRELLASPASPLEPRFLHEGRDLWTALDGTRVRVAVPREGAVAKWTLHVARGATADPLACLAAAVWQEAWRRSAPAAPWAFDLRCTARSVELTVTAAAEDSERVWVVLGRRGRVDLERVGPAGLEALRAKELARRAAERRSLRAVAGALHGIALWGARATSPSRVADGALRRVSWEDVRASLERLLAAPTDLVYVGPGARQSLERLARWPAGDGARGRRDMAPAPGRLWVARIAGETMADLQVARVLPVRSHREQVLADLYRTWVYGRLHAVARDLGAPGGLDVRWRSDRDDPVAKAALAVRLQVPGERVAQAIGAVDRLLAEGPGQEAFDRVRGQVERYYRGKAMSAFAVGRVVRQWRVGGDGGDPSVEMWTALADITPEEFEAFARRVSEGARAVSVVAGEDLVLGERPLGLRLREVPLDELIPPG